MAQIDLRNATLDIVSGDTVSGTIADGYPIGTTTMTIDTITMAVPNGSKMTIAGQGTIYTVSSTVGTTTPTNVTFTPALTAAVADNQVITFQITGLQTAGGTQTAGASALNVTGLTEAIEDGTTFQITGDATVYTITSSVGGTTPTSLNISPVLAADAATGAAITLFRNAAVNHASAAPTNGDTSFGVNGFSVALTEGMIFTITGSTDSYEIVSSTGGATPTAITFTPALRTAAGIPAAGAAITVHTNVLRIKIGEGNLTFDEKRNMEYVRNQRQIAFVRTGDDEPMDVSLDFIWEFLSSTSTDTVPTPDEAIKGIGLAASWTTSGADPCEPYAVDLRLTYTPPCSGVDREITTLPEFRWESLPHDLKAGTVSAKGKCKQLSPTYKRSA